MRPEKDRKLRVLTTRQEISAQSLAGATAVVFDVFMATTTLLTILENGARAVYPVESLQAAENLRQKLDPENVLRGGEQDAALVEGYDHGPFPQEYTPEIVRDKDVVFLTTNGTRAIADAVPADRVLLGCLRNAPAVARRLAELDPDKTYLVCAGSGGRFALEDFLAAAAVLGDWDTAGHRLNDAAWLALDLARRYEGREEEALRESRAGRWFFEHGRVDAFDFVADVGASEIVPEVRDGRLHGPEGYEARPESPEDESGGGLWHGR